MNEVTVINRAAADVEAYRASTEAADLCKEIVVATSSTIQGKRYVAVEGWQAIAIAHGCALSAKDVARIDGGVRAIGEVHRMSDGQLIATAEGFVGEDEAVWFGGTDKRGKKHDKRSDFAIRAMAQTRSMSRAGRTAFAHVVVMMNAGLATTPAEEMIAIDGATGEIFETNGPAPRTKLEGPYTSKTALKNAIHVIASGVRDAKVVEAIDNAVKAGKEAIKQAERDWPELLTGDPNLEGDDEGLKRLVARRREELTPSVESEDFKMCMETLETCTSTQELSAWFKLNSKYVETLDGEEGDRIQRRYDELEAGLKAAAPLSAG